MVTINTSNTLFTNLNADDQGAENDSSGIENLFASMFSTMDEKNKSTGDKAAFTKIDDVEKLMEQIKKNLLKNPDGSPKGVLDEESKNRWDSNVLKIYETYKSLMTDSIASAEEPTIRFNIDGKLTSGLENSNKKSTNVNTMPKPSNLTLSDLHEAAETESKEDFIASFRQFSKGEMQRLQTSLNQARMKVEDPAEDNKKLDASQKFSKISEIQAFVTEQQKTPSQQGKKKSFNENSKEQAITVKSLTDHMKPDTISDSNSNASKSGSSSKQISFENNSQNVQTNIEAHLKLLQKNWGKNLAKIIENAVAQGKEKIEISLEPQRLGKMYLTMSVTSNQTTISINTETAAASLILSGSEERLAQMFESSGLKLSNFQANSNNANSNKNRSDTQKQEESKIIKLAKDKEPSSEEAVLVSDDTNGRKIVNLIA